MLSHLLSMCPTTVLLKPEKKPLNSHFASIITTFGDTATVQANKMKGFGSRSPCLYHPRVFHGKPKIIEGRWLLSHESVQMWHTTFSPPMPTQAAWVKLAIKSTKQLFFLTSSQPQTIWASFHPASASVFSSNDFPGFILLQFQGRIIQVLNHQKGYV